MTLSIYLTLNVHFPICLMFQIIIIVLGHCLINVTIMLIEWHKSRKNDVFDFAKEIQEYCKADVQLIKSGCIKFRNAFITDTGIDPIQSCTIV